MKKKIALLIAMMVTAASCISVFAEENDDGRYIYFEQNGVELKLNKDNGEVKRAATSYERIGADTPLGKKINAVKLTIPSSQDGVAITSIKSSGFNDFDDMTSLTLPETITQIGEYAFNGCDSIVTIKIPSKVTEVQKNCFSGCDSLETVVLHNGITKIGEYAFARCYKLANVTVPTAVKEIGANAFEGTDIKNVVIPASTEKLGNAAFKNCKSLVSVKIGSGVKTIPTDCFSGCDAITTIEVPATVSTIDHTAFSNCKNLKTVIIPDTVKKISADAFNGSKSVTIACNAGSEAEIAAKKAGVATTDISSAKVESKGVAVRKDVPDTISVTIDGVKQNFKQDPVNMGGSVLVPMRAIFEALGADVSWDQGTKTVTARKGATTVTCKIDYTIGSLNGKTTTLAAAPKIVNGATMVPVRFVSESLGCKVSWEKDTQTVIISSK